MLNSIPLCTDNTSIICSFVDEHLGRFLAYESLKDKSFYYFGILGEPCNLKKIGISLSFDFISSKDLSDSSKQRDKWSFEVPGRYTFKHLYQ
jgi:hypothetical protein